MKPLVIYHAQCADGFTAAWVARRHFLLRHGVEPELHAAHYGSAPPDVAGRCVAIVDFSYPRETLIAMHAAAESLIVLDHHRTAQADLDGLPFCLFDMERSGAGLAWDHYFGGSPIAEENEPRPWLVDYVEDRDLWRWERPHAREVSAGLAIYGFDLATWDEFAAGVSSLYDLADEGRTVLRYQARAVRSHVEKAKRYRLAGYEVPVVNATTLVSEIGNELAREAPFAALWFEADGAFVYSLRSSAENPEHVDVSEIARRFGGGGHRHAAGFKSIGFAHAHEERL